jgi:hypothetical protein
MISSYGGVINTTRHYDRIVAAIEVGAALATNIVASNETVTENLLIAS